MQVSLTAIRTRGSLHTHQCGGSHLSSRHTIDGIIDEDDSDVLPTVQGMNGLTGSDTGKVTVTLISKHETVGPQALDSGSHSRGTSMGSLLPVDVQIIIGKHGTAHG